VVGVFQVVPFEDVIRKTPPFPSVYHILYVGAVDAPPK
jgi:hypothetical protein